MRRVDGAWARFGYGLATLGLGPLLMWQGRRVRRDTPRLPEPPGERSGLTGCGPLLRLLILGDSSAAGVGAPHQRMALSGQLTAALAQHHTLQWRLRATTGQTLSDVLQCVAQAPVEHFDVVVVAVGVNDATGRTRMAAWRQGLVRLVKLIQTQHAPRLILMSRLPPVHAFPALPQPLRWYLGWRSKQLSAAKMAVLADHPVCEVAAVEFPIEPSFMAEDGFHPGPPAYAMWARHLASLIRRRMQAAGADAPHARPEG